MDNPLELCDMCKHQRTFRYDFDRRCCRARHTLAMNKSMRQAKYALVNEKYGEDTLRQLVADVKALWEFYEGLRLAEGVGNG
jgi:hypothetical protein